MSEKGREGEREVEGKGGMLRAAPSDRLTVLALLILALGELSEWQCPSPG